MHVPYDCTRNETPEHFGAATDESANSRVRRALRGRVAVFFGAALSLSALASAVLAPAGSESASAGERSYSARAVDLLVRSTAEGTDEPLVAGDNPHSIKDEGITESYRAISLDEAIEYALSHSRVMRDLGGTILTTPDAMKTKYAGAIQSSDPRFGVDAALSDFDARFSLGMNFEKNDRALNNQFFGGGTRLFQQDLNTYQAQLSKQAATGTEYYLMHFTDYNANNAPANLFPSAWNSNIELGFRHPLLQGSGVDFNRIAGPRGIPGMLNGVQIARTNTKISEIEFEVGLRDFVSNVANAYWDLYYAYRELDSKINARDAALELWRKAFNDKGADDTEKALAQEQYFRFEEEVQNALAGRQFEGTRTNNGTMGGTFRATGGVLVAERRLRLLMGMPISEPSLLRPNQDPDLAEIIFNWDVLVCEAIERRPELKRQRLRVQRRDMELTASRNFLLPRLDATGRYRWRGFGKDLASGPAFAGEFSDAWSNLYNGNFQEWQLGVELEVPLGFRRGHSAVHNAELQLARERTILAEQERQIIHDLSQAVAEMDRAYKVSQTNLNRFRVIRKAVETMEAAMESGRPVGLDKLFDARRRLADAESRYFLSRVEYALAIKNVNYEKGSLLEYFDLLVSDVTDTGRHSGYESSPSGFTPQPLPPEPAPPAAAEASLPPALPVE
jgi:outer membrane protein TolC